MTAKKHDCLTCTGYGAGCDGSEPCAMDILDDDSTPTGHTPGKLTVLDCPKVGVVRIIDDMGSEIAETVLRGESDKANAARLALCWNTHDELVEAAAKFLAFYKDLAASNPGFMGKLCLQDYAQWNEALVELPAALEAANAPLSDSDS